METQSGNPFSNLLESWAQWFGAAGAAGLGANDAGHASSIAALQQETLARHAQLWQRQLLRRPGETVAPVIDAARGDWRFIAPEWSESPFHDYLRQAYLINADYLMRAVELMPLATEADRKRLRFMTRQYVDALAPSNFAATNPEFIQQALLSNGESIARGVRNMLGDLEKGRISMSDESAFEVGKNLAVTPGAVIFENEVMQLIQYAPSSDEKAAKVFERPFVIVPPCINRYYILDLQPENSFVRYAVAQGHTVFLVSWRNPHEAEGKLSWDDFVAQPLIACKIAAEVCKSEQVNALGFCIGGTLLASALAVARARGEDPVHSLTLLTTPLDFEDAGELGCFIDPASIAAREASIGKGGLMHGKEFAAAFASLRANDLIWNYVVGNYLKGHTPPAFDLLFWNADSTNLPGPFAAWYLRHLYLENELRIPGKLTMLDTPVDLRKVDMPTFIYASREDHIVPWKSAYQSRALIGGKNTFVLGASGHIAGVINPPQKNKRSHWRLERDSEKLDAEAWQGKATEHPGSWWPVWAEWLAQYGGKQVAARKKLGSSKYKEIEAAPGRYVKQ
ncbi:MAG: class I poly(R)-hydroxyalkanoic acid synthase [Rhodocyclaceae bacterium]|nr:class I poly(R)-hydroxyalkanoic acid synthase [Rhodocyclaceae bacterium]